jgi:hypothetical protein
MLPHPSSVIKQIKQSREMSGAVQVKLQVISPVKRENKLRKKEMSFKISMK